MGKTSKTPNSPDVQDEQEFVESPDGTETSEAPDTSASPDDDQRPRRQLPELPPWALPGIVAVCWLLAAVIGWRALAQMNAEGASARTDGARDRVAGAVASLPSEPRQRFAGLLQTPDVLAAAKAGDFEGAATLLKTRWPELAEVSLYSPDLSEAYDNDLRAFGYSRLAVLQESASSAMASNAFASRQGAIMMELAAPVHERGQMLAVAYGRVAIPQLAQLVQDNVPAAGYLALRQGDAVLVEAGDTGLASRATGVSIPGSSLVAVSAHPTANLVFGLSGVLLLRVAFLFALLGAVALWLWRRKPNEIIIEKVITREKRVLVKGKSEKDAKPAGESAAPVDIARNIFRAYDIRGVVGKDLDGGIARLIGQAVGTLMRDKGLREIVVGRDGRLSGPELAAELIIGLRKAGCDVIDIGEAPTPLVYFATHHLHTGSGVAVTGSHNPADYNGFKIMVGGETLSGDAIQDLYARIAENDLESEGNGGLQHIRVDDDYANHISGDVQIERSLKVVVDAGNGVAGGIAPQVLEGIGCEVVPLYCEVDGEFPNHHPDPSDPDNLRDLITFVQKLDADLGIAFDGDGDRLGVVTREGEIIYPDRLLMLFAQDVLMRNPGATVIYDVKCTGHLASHILRHGGSPIMWKTGHSLIKAKMKETHAELAGEMSGHFFFKERWFGFDDGIYSAARLLEILAMDGREASEVFADLPKGVSTPELKIAMHEGEHYAFIQRFQREAKFEGAKLSSIDGIRADWSDGWGLVRASNTTPSLVLRFDADNGEALSRIQEAFRGQLLAVDAALDLPY
ncbi:MAG: phosphomannomutase/phosphoglucomutase [Lysobacteraceae bacterium]